MFERWKFKVKEIYLVFVWFYGVIIVREEESGNYINKGLNFYLLIKNWDFKSLVFIF